MAEGVYRRTTEHFDPVRMLYEARPQVPQRMALKNLGAPPNAAQCMEGIGKRHMQWLKNNNVLIDQICLAEWQEQKPYWTVVEVCRTYVRI